MVIRAIITEIIPNRNVSLDPKIGVITQTITVLVVHLIGVNGNTNVHKKDYGGDLIQYTIIKVIVVNKR